MLGRQGLADIARHVIEFSRNLRDIEFSRNLRDGGDKRVASDDGGWRMLLATS